MLRKGNKNCCRVAPKTNDRKSDSLTTYSPTCLGKSKWEKGLMREMAPCVCPAAIIFWGDASPTAFHTFLSCTTSGRIINTNARFCKYLVSKLCCGGAWTDLFLEARSVRVCETGSFSSVSSLAYSGYHDGTSWRVWTV